MCFTHLKIPLLHEKEIRCRVLGLKVEHGGTCLESQPSEGRDRRILAKVKATWPQRESHLKMQNNLPHPQRILGESIYALVECVENRIFVTIQTYSLHFLVASQKLMDNRCLGSSPTSRIYLLFHFWFFETVSDCVFLAALELRM